jgi:osmotically-inducible protein OsmY
MPGFQKFPTNYIILTSLLALNGCVAPFVVGGAAAAGMIATREKGIGGTVSDSNICSKVKANLYNFNADLHAKVSVSVQNQEVLLTGVVQDPTWSSIAEELAKKVGDVKAVHNNIETEGEESIGSMSKDGWITTRIKSSLLFEDDLYSLNYTIETSNGIVYLTGVGQNEAEINKVVEIARNVSGVRKVVNLVKVKGQESQITEPSPSSAEAPPVNAAQPTEVEDRG